MLCYACSTTLRHVRSWNFVMLNINYLYEREKLSVIYFCFICKYSAVLHEWFIWNIGKKYQMLVTNRCCVQALQRIWKWMLSWNEAKWRHHTRCEDSKRYEQERNFFDALVKLISSSIVCGLNDVTLMYKIRKMFTIKEESFLHSYLMSA